MCGKLRELNHETGRQMVNSRIDKIMMETRNKSEFYQADTKSAQNAVAL